MLSDGIMIRLDATILCLGGLLVGFFLGHSLIPHAKEDSLDSLNANLSQLNQTLKTGLLVRADIAGIGGRKIAMYQNQANQWIVGSRDQTSSDIDPLMLFNYDWATLESSGKTYDPPPTLKPPGLSPVEPSTNAP